MSICDICSMEGVAIEVLKARRGDGMELINEGDVFGVCAGCSEEAKKEYDAVAASEDEERTFIPF